MILLNKSTKGYLNMFLVIIDNMCSLSAMEQVKTDIYEDETITEFFEECGIEEISVDIVKLTDTIEADAPFNIYIDEDEEDDVENYVYQAGDYALVISSPYESYELLDILKELFSGEVLYDYGAVSIMELTVGINNKIEYIEDQ